MFVLKGFLEFFQLQEFTELKRLNKFLEILEYTQHSFIIVNVLVHDFRHCRLRGAHITLLNLLAKENISAKGDLVLLLNITIYV